MTKKQQDEPDDKARRRFDEFNRQRQVVPDDDAGHTRTEKQTRKAGDQDEQTADPEKKDIHPPKKPTT